jgi:hypothetical protein
LFRISSMSRFKIFFLFSLPINDFFLFSYFYSSR